MKELRFTLLSDGSSDRAILPLLQSLVEHHCTALPVHGTWADLRRLPTPPKTLPERIDEALRLYPCDLLFLHRDAERSDPRDRDREIRDAAARSVRRPVETTVPVIPVRMQEAWLLVDEEAIRRAAGNPNGQEPLDLPPLHRIESVPDPKGTLHEALRQASGRRGVRRKRFPVHERAHRVAQHLPGLERHRELPAFRLLEQRLTGALERIAGSRAERRRGP